MRRDYLGRTFVCNSRTCRHAFTAPVRNRYTAVVCPRCGGSTHTASPIRFVRPRNT